MILHFVDVTIGSEGNLAHKTQKRANKTLYEETTYISLDPMAQTL